jgi:hypothetical protein
MLIKKRQPKGHGDAEQKMRGIPNNTAQFHSCIPVFRLKSSG